MESKYRGGEEEEEKELRLKVVEMPVAKSIGKTEEKWRKFKGERSQFRGEPNSFIFDSNTQR